MVLRLGAGVRVATDVTGVLRAAVDSLVPEVGDLAVALARRPGDRDLVEAAHGNPARQEQVREAVERLAPELSAAGRQHAKNGDRRWMWVPNTQSYSMRRLTGGHPALEELLETLGIRSLIVVGLGRKTDPFGALAVARTSEGSPFHASEFAVVRVLAHRTTLALNAAQLHDLVLDADATQARFDQALSKWTQVFNLASWGAAVVGGEDRRIDAVNPAFARLHGYPDPEQLLGRCFTDFLPPGAEDETVRWPSDATRLPDAYESEHRRAGGTVFPALTNVTALSGDQPTFIVTVQDLGPLKRAEERLQRAQRMEAVGRLAGGVAHEVNNMMTIILGFSDLLSRSPELPAPLQRDVDEIQKAATRAGHITRQLLAYSRRQVLEPTVLDLDLVVEEMTRALRPLLPVHTRVEARPGAGGTRVRADRAQLEQVVINLAFNARDAMPRGGQITIGTGVRQLDERLGREKIGIPIVPGSYICFEVRDTGMGISEEVRDHLFEPFFTTKDAGHGTGLGLATVYGIVKQSGGYVWADANPGGGTTFTVCLPEVALEEDASAETAADASHSRPGETVLVVEDEEGVRELAARILRDEGYHVMEARTGREAMEALDHVDRLDLVLMDLVMPDMGGSEARDHILKRRPDVAVLYMSGYPKDDVLQRPHIEGGDPFLAKPFTREGLTERVREILDAPRLS
ncbi:MAG: response regulator [Gemmatimonadales bacterium]|nr:response regulator [Gemmatimonadales bacterium]